MTEITVHLRTPHSKQRDFINSRAKRKILRAGRRSGKTTGIAIPAVKAFLAGKRVLYATPTQEQVSKFWFEVKRALREPIDAGIFNKNETNHVIELPGTEQRIRAKTAWDADTMRGDFADYLIFDEYQDMKEEVWNLVGAPMLLDNNGDAVFIYTSKQGNKHSKELFNRAKADKSGRWDTFIFTSFDNPHISRVAIDELAADMTQLAYRAEILAEEIDDDPAALWTRDIIDHVTEYPPLFRIGVGVDPTGSARGDECGIIVGGVALLNKELHGYVLADKSLHGTSAQWARESVSAYNVFKADRIFGERNFGGDMVENTIRTVEGGADVSYEDVIASRGKMVRAEPVSALYERGRIHHVGEFNGLEDEQCNWVPGKSKYSPNRIDALTWLFTKLIVEVNQAYMSDLPQDKGRASVWEVTQARDGDRERERPTANRWTV